MDLEITSIRISKELKKRLRKLEEHHRETDAEIIHRLIKLYEIKEDEENV